MGFMPFKMKNLLLEVFDGARLLRFARNDKRGPSLRGAERRSNLKSGNGAHQLTCVRLGSLLLLSSAVIACIPQSGVVPGTFRRPLIVDISGLDPVRIQDVESHLIGSQIFEGLIEIDDNTLEIKPLLAERYEISPDGRTYTFHLRKGVRFQDDPCFLEGKGREVVASDFKYSLERIVDPSNLSTGWWLFDNRIVGANEYREELSSARKEEREPTLDSVEGYEVVDEYTFKIHLKQPFGPFIHILGMSYAAAVPREAVEMYGKDFFRNPVGTGPYRLGEWRDQLRLVLVRNPNYWDKDEAGKPYPYLDRIVTRIMREATIAFMEFESGNLDVTGIPPQMWKKVFDENNELRQEYREKYQLRKIPRLATYYLGFMMDKEPLGTSKKLRQAFNHALNRQAVCDIIMNGRGIPAKGILPPGLPGFNEELEGYTYDPDKARQLLAEAGYPGGKGLEPIKLFATGGDRTMEDLSVAVQNDLKEVGVEIEIQNLTWPQLLESIDKHEPAFFRAGWIADYPDPENFLALFYSKNHSPHGPNNSLYSNPRFDDLFERALRLPRLEDRIPLYQEAERIVVEDAPVVFQYSSVTYRLEQPYVRNYPANPMDIGRWKDVWFDLENTSAK